MAARVDTLGVAIRSAIERLQEAERLSFETNGREGEQAVEQGWADLQALEDQIPRPPRSIEDIVLQAEIAFFATDKTGGGDLLELDSVDVFERSAARLVQSVLQLAGMSIVRDGFSSRAHASSSS